MQDTVLRSDRNGITTLILNRPDKLNALSNELFTALNGHIENIEKDADTVRIVVVRGAGRCFSAGRDLRDLAAGEDAPAANYQAKVIERLANLPQPVLCAVHGHCFTGALELALAADLIIAAESANFADTHAKFALTPIWGISQRLPRRIGLAKAREMILTARSFSGTEAAQMGLANMCVPDTDFDKEVDKLASQILENSSFSLAAYKALLSETDGLPIRAGLSHEIYHTRGRGPDMQDRIEAFVSKKKETRNSGS